MGEFPPLWTEWNGKYRDTVRDFWRGTDTGVAEFGYRLSGSSDLYQDDGRRPYASINFVTAHDGFTLADLVSYNDKHNEANREDNRDGDNHNRSWNCGVEGPTDDKDDPRAAGAAGAQLPDHAAAVDRRAHAGGRRRDRPHARAATTTPTARTTRSPGWTGISTRTSSTSCVWYGTCWRCGASTRCSGSGRSSAAGRSTTTVAVKDLAWFTAAGVEMTDRDWFTQSARTIGMYLSGARHPQPRPAR